MSLGEWLLSGTSSSLLLPMSPSHIKPNRKLKPCSSETQHAPLKYF